ncbi:MAG: thermonuclease family protein [Stappiaceae bacterium]
MKLLPAILLLYDSAPFPPKNVPEPKPLPQFEYCVSGKQRTADTTCVVDGDTVWLKGEKIRLRDFDTPETYTAFCKEDERQQRYEKALGRQAALELLYLLNYKRWTIEYFGMDRSGKRRLATIRIDGKDVGDMLIEKRLARRWPKGDEFWCDYPVPGRPPLPKFKPST